LIDASPTPQQPYASEAVVLQPTADVLAGVFTTAFYKNAATQHLDASLRIIHFLLKRLA
jgi:hypothetical protein